jgi:hypothetical protein
VTPVCRADTSCDAPAKNVRLVFSRAGVVRSVTTAADGTYLIRLHYGWWAVRLPGWRLSYGPKAVFVRAGVIRRQDFSIDTGIR